jgi:D-glycerate 3-kinase
MPVQLPRWQEAFLQRNQLPRTYLSYAQQWFEPLAEALVVHQNGAARPLLVVVNGSQGSGKSTVCDYLRSLLADLGRRVVSLSLDDFYLTRSQRAELASTVHPLLATRGVPGTHDMVLLNETLDGLLGCVGESGAVAIPRFDKASDDRRAPVDWDRSDAPVDLVLLEGWCLGALPQSEASLAEPVNSLERDEDSQGLWRAYANAALARDFEPLYRRVDQWVMLCAPSFDCVYQWRLQQEQKLLQGTNGSGGRIMNAAQIARFIQHYERLTRECLEHLPQRVDYLYRLDDQRGISALQRRGELS